ncbi:dienelactone hydrolase family protein [cf. Phormidesmis sp. LEGE 11477]|nr:dienelactone hydrolase family protein [cf. Phormidesmis sp. LEGE 11477]
MALSITLLFQACGAQTSGQSNGADGVTDGSSREAATETTATDPLANEHEGDKPTATPIAMAEPTVPVTGQAVTYAEIEGQAITGYLAQPSEPTSDALPGILTIHEWWGLNENIEAMTRRLAGEGYTALALDLYNDQVATDPQSARELLRSVMDNPGPAQDNILQAASFLETEYNAPTLGSIGWCFGGTWSLRTGLLLSSDLDAMAIYYGQLILAPEALDALDMPIIGFFGEEDSSIPVTDVQNFESTLENIGKTADINLYPGVGHAFANPSGQNYNADAAADAWEKTVAFFNTHLKT